MTQAHVAHKSENPSNLLIGSVNKTFVLQSGIKSQYQKLFSRKTISPSV